MHFSITNIQSTPIQIHQGAVLGYLVDMPDDFVNSVIEVPSILEKPSHTPDFMFMIPELLAHPEITTTEHLVHHFQALSNPCTPDAAVFTAVYTAVAASAAAASTIADAADVSDHNNVLDPSDFQKNFTEEFTSSIPPAEEYHLYVTGSDGTTRGAISLVSSALAHRVLSSEGKCPLPSYIPQYTPPFESPLDCFVVHVTGDSLESSSADLDSDFAPDSVTPWLDSDLPDPSALLPEASQTLPPRKDSTMEEKMDYLHDPKPLSDAELLAQIDLAHITDPAQKQRLTNFLLEYGDIFRPHVVTGLQSPGEHTIELKPYTRAPISTPYPEGVKRAAVIGEHIDTMLKDKIIRPSRPPFAAPVCLVRKKDGSLRFSTDFRRLNDVTIKDKYPLPKIDDTFNHLAGMCLFTFYSTDSGRLPLKRRINQKLRLSPHKVCLNTT
jgi:hypothetical protein